MNRFSILLVCSLLTTAAPALAQPRAAATTHDLQCLVVGAELANSENEQIKNAGVLVGLFFAGKVFADEPKIDLSAALKIEFVRLTPEDTTKLQKEYGMELSSRGSQLKTAAKVLSDELAVRSKP